MLVYLSIALVVCALAGFKMISEIISLRIEISKNKLNYNKMKIIKSELTYPIGTKLIYSGNEPDSEIVIHTVCGYDKFGRMLNKHGWPISGRKYYPWLHELLKGLSWEKRYILCTKHEHCHLSEYEVDRKNSFEYRNRLTSD